MSHQPYETWLLEPEELTAQQAAELQAHLETCPECKQLDNAWRNVLGMIRSEPVVPAPAGFTQRWKADLGARKAEKQARQIRRTLFLMVAGIVVVTLGFVAYLAATMTPADIMVHGMRTITIVSSSTREAQQFLQYLLRITPPIIPIFLGLAAASWVLALSLTWVITVMRFSFKGEPNL